MLEKLNVLYHWDWVLHGLGQIQRKVPSDALDWTPREVLLCLLNGTAVLYSDSEDYRAGFVILVPRINSIKNRKELIVWIAFSPRGDAQTRFLDDIKRIARAIGATRLTMCSPRPGFAKSEWTPVTTEYFIEVGSDVE